ncbi:unnamed protein product [Phytophthora lilii]|uniref:Unnamed protein product n=1 Tax=Phytophthora lilii TaxID=2077276 RepID=A0A9W6TUH1_9STRA|nr:unnamed protein product [Phytophthora lilii]
MFWRRGGYCHVVIFDIVDLEAKGAISTTDLIMGELPSDKELLCEDSCDARTLVLVCGAVGRAIMKLFEYKVEPEQHAAMAYVTDVLDSLGVARNGTIAKEALCKFMVSDRFAVHYVKQCTGEGVFSIFLFCF